MAEQPAALIDRGAEPALRRGPAKPTPSIVMHFVRPAPFLREALASIVARRGDEIEQVVVAGHPGDLLRTLFDLSPRGNAIRVVVDSARLRAITAARQKGLVVVGCGLVEDRLFPRSETSRGYGATAE
jgi:hypothetical protein